MRTAGNDSGLHKLRRAFWANAEHLACKRFRRRLRVNATDKTTDMAGRNALILAPHADDETLGCGGVIALKRQVGTTVTVAIATDGSASHRTETWAATTPDQLIALRETETRAACETLGVSAQNVRFLKLPDGDLAGHMADLVTSIADLLQVTRPDDIFVCAERDGHPDHTALAQATHRALQGYDGDIRVLEYPVWCFDFRSWRAKGMTNTNGFIAGIKDMRKTAQAWKLISVQIADVVDLKAAALAAHQSQLGTYGPEPQWSGLPHRFIQHFLSNTEVFRLIPHKGDAAE